MDKILLRVEHVSKYYGAFLALDDVSFDIREKRVIGLLGPNGAGKTTLFNCLTGFDTIHAGRFVFRNRVLPASPAAVVSAGITRTFQNVRLFPSMTILENILMGCYAQRRRYSSHVWRDRACQLLKKIDLLDYQDRSIHSLSYGQKRYVEIARALIAEPVLLAMDEPAAGLNNRETKALSAWIREIADSGITVMVIEHDMSMMMGLCDELVVLNYGHLIAIGTPADIKVHPEVVAAYLGSQYVS